MKTFCKSSLMKLVYLKTINLSVKFTVEMIDLKLNVN